MTALYATGLQIFWASCLVVALHYSLSGLAIAVQYLRASRALNKEARHG